MSEEKREVINLDVHIRWKDDVSEWEIQATHYGRGWNTQFQCMVPVNNGDHLKRAIAFLSETILIHIDKEERMMSIPDIADPPYDLEADIARAADAL